MEDRDAAIRDTAQKLSAGVDPADVLLELHSRKWPLRDVIVIMRNSLGVSLGDAIQLVEKSKLWESEMAVVLQTSRRAVETWQEHE